MAAAFKSINGNMQSIIPFKLYKTWNLDSGSYKHINPISGSLVVYDAKANYDINTYDNYSIGTSSGSVWYSIRNLFYEGKNGSYVSPRSNEFKIKNPLTSSALVISIPRKMFWEGIVPGTFNFTDISASNIINVTDDGYGDLYDSNNINANVIGNISYSSGLVIFTESASYTQLSSSLFIYSSSVNESMYYTSYYTAYQHEYMCDVKSYEFNNTSNPTAFIENADGTKVFKFSNILDATGSQIQFKPLVTGISLCDDSGTALVIAKFAKPIRMENNMDSVFIVRYDT